MLNELGEAVGMLARASAQRKAKVYCQLGLRLIYYPEKQKVLVTQGDDRDSIGYRFVSEGT